MATCWLLSMSVTQKLGHLQPVSSSRGLCVWMHDRRIPVSGHMGTRACLNIKSVGMSEAEFGAAAREPKRREGEEAVKAGRILEKRASHSRESEVPSNLVRMGVIVSSPALGMSMFDSTSVADDGGLGSTFSVELLRQTAVLGDLDPGTAQLATSLLGPFIAILNFLFILRIVMSWYPGIPVKKFPFFLAYNPTEPLLGPTRRLIPPVGGVDVAPVIWVALISFANEVLLGKQGLLVLLSQQQP